MDSLDPVKFRKSQESLFNMIKMGYFKQLAEFHKATYDAYMEVGFTAEQALKLLEAMIADKKDQK